MAKKVFATITNEDILSELHKQNDILNEIRNRVAATNGSVKLHEKLIWGLFGLFGAGFTLLLSIILKMR